VRTRAGVTLIELMVVLVLLSVIASVVTLAMRAAPSARPVDAAVTRVLAARDTALRTGRPLTITVLIASMEHSATAYPDGRLVADSAFHFDLVSGRPSDATR
jgi:prepilin-type N-terminal cleavage/methylation domain-containing protein